MSDDTRNLRTLYVSFRDTSRAGYEVPLSRDAAGEIYTVETTIGLPKGKSIVVYAEVFLDEDPPDVALSIEEDAIDVCGLRCSSGVVLTYVSRSGYEVLLQVGSGPWE